jgi:phosphoribosylformimino-5-aminoimidazole carboxamide ribonucleotide (ProFAR) isomerase
VAAGAGWLHVVDLDGARDGVPRQAGVQAAILGGVGDRARVQLAGGLRDATAVEAALAAGAARVVLGTAALDDPAFVAGLVARHGSDRIVVALDVRHGVAVGSGWVDGTVGTPVDTAAAALVDAGVRIFAVTAIARDGTMAGPDLALLERFVGRVPGVVIASGGIGSLDDLRRVRALGCAGAILGRALYEGRFSLPDALAAVD